MRDLRRRVAQGWQVLLDDRVRRQRRERLRRADDDLAIAALDAAELLHPLQPHEVARREQLVLHVGHQVGAAGDRHDVPRVRIEQLERLIQPGGPVIPIRM
jgi:hypothetical protein